MINVLTLILILALIHLLLPVVFSEGVLKELAKMALAAIVLLLIGLATMLLIVNYLG